MSNMNNTEFEFDWDTAIEKDGDNFAVLPEGEYEFEVTGFERQRYMPTEKSKIPACPMALLKIRVGSGEQSTMVEEHLYLHSSSEWKLCQFFTAIGQRKRGERLIPNWRAVTGSKGRCKLVIREWTDRNGNKRQNNQISTYLEPDADAQARNTSGYGGGF